MSIDTRSGVTKTCKEFPCFQPGSHSLGIDVHFLCDSNELQGYGKPKLSNFGDFGAG